jgi:uncharacterized delta-60 repeat protein
MKRSLVALAAALMGIGVVSLAAAAAGQLDPSFGNGGIVTTPVGVGAGSDNVPDLVVQPDAKLVVPVWARSSAANGGVNFTLVRYSRHGDLDSTFGTGGVATTRVAPGGNRDDIWAATIQPDGKIVAVGRALMGAGAGGSDFALVRYLPDGSLDPSFGGDGIVTTGFGPTEEGDAAFAVALQPDGKIVAAGQAGPTFSPADFALARYESDGDLDPTFGEGGLVRTTLEPVNDDWIEGVAIQDDGKIMTVGAAVTGPGDGGPEGDIDHAWVRYDSTGALDPTFSDDGKLVLGLGDGTNRDGPWGGIALQSDGKIVSGGVALTGPANANREFAFSRLTDDGSLDSSFGTGGIVRFGIAPGNEDDIIWDLTLDPSERIVAVGQSRVFDGAEEDFAVVRLLPDGSLDGSFGTGGFVTTAIGPGYDAPFGVAVDKTGKIAVAGECDMGPPGGVDVCLARYKSGTDD